MNTRRGKVDFKNFIILIDSECSPTILIISMITKFKTKIYAVMQWKIQSGNLTPNMKVKMYFK